MLRATSPGVAGPDRANKARNERRPVPPSDGAGDIRHKEEQVAEGNEPDDGRVSREAFERVTKERDDLKARTGELEATVGDIGRTRKIEDILEAQKVKNPRYVAEMMLPHVRDVELDQLEDKLSSERFQPMVSAFAAGDGTEGGEGEGGSTKEPPQDPGPGFSGPGPSPGGGGTPPNPNEKIRRDSPKFRQLVAEGNHDEIERLYSEGLVESPARTY